MILHLRAVGCRLPYEITLTPARGRYFVYLLQSNGRLSWSEYDNLTLWETVKRDAALSVGGHDSRRGRRLCTEQTISYMLPATSSSFMMATMVAYKCSRKTY